MQGPQAAATLGEWGADVIKAELPGFGDQARWLPVQRGDYRSAYFAACNRGKRSITVDLRRPEGREIFLRLGAWADVVITNFKPGTMESWGLGYDELAERNAGLIYAAGSTFGLEGPDAAREGADLSAQAVGGLISTTGRTGGEPSPVGATIADHIAALNLVGGILAALVARQRTGVGQRVDTSLVGGQLWAQASEITGCLMTGRPGGRANRGNPYVPGLYAIFPTRDGWLAVVGVVGPAHPVLRRHRPAGAGRAVPAAALLRGGARQRCSPSSTTSSGPARRRSGASCSGLPGCASHPCVTTARSSPIRWCGTTVTSCGRRRRTAPRRPSSPRPSGSARRPPTSAPTCPSSDSTPKRCSSSWATPGTTSASCRPRGDVTRPRRTGEQRSPPSAICRPRSRGQSTVCTLRSSPGCRPGETASDRDWGDVARQPGCANGCRTGWKRFGRRARRGGGRCRLRRAVHAPPAASAGVLDDRAGVGRRRRRDLVLEPLPGRTLRHPDHRLHVLVRPRAGSRVDVVGEVRHPARDPRATSSTSPRSTTCGRTSVSRPVWRRRRGTTTPRAGRSRRTRAIACRAGGSSWRRDACRCPRRSTSTASTASPVTSTSRAAGRTRASTSPAAGRRHRYRFVGDPVDPADRRAGSGAGRVPAHPELLDPRPQRSAVAGAPRRDRPRSRRLPAVRQVVTRWHALRDPGRHGCVAAAGRAARAIRGGVGGRRAVLDPRHVRRRARSTARPTTSSPSTSGARSARS